MNYRFLLVTMLLLSTVIVGAQSEKVQQYFKVSDNNFNVAYWQDASNPNDYSTLENSFTINCEFGAVAWEWGYFWETDNVLDMSIYDKLVIRVASVEGNSVSLQIFDYDALNGMEGYVHPDDIVEMDEEVEYIVDLTEDLERNDGSGILDLSKIKLIKFWNYWDVHNDEDEDGIPDYDTPLAEVTVKIAAMYLERTLADGEKDYYDLLSENEIQFTDSYLEEEEGSYMDNTGTLHLKENAMGGIYYDGGPADWSTYKYLVVVPKVPFEDPMPTVRYVLTDWDDNAYDGGTLRHGYWNRARAAVQDLTTITEQAMDNDVYLDAFDPTRIYSLEWALWGGVQEIEYGLAGVWLSNTCPTYSTSFGEGTDDTGDYVIENASANTITTICLPFACALCGAEVYTVAGVNSLDDPQELYATPHIGILEAGKPYIIMTNSTRNITAFKAGANEVSTPVDNGALKANSFNTYYVSPDQNYLVLDADGTTFEAVIERSKRVNSNTAYIDANALKVAEEQENGLVFNILGATEITPQEGEVEPEDPDEGDTNPDNPSEDTGIKGVNMGAQNANSAKIYDVTGREVKTVTKGLYIKSGKKIVVR